MSVETNKAIILKSWECVSAKDLDGLAELYAPDAVYHGVDGQELAGRDAVVAGIGEYLTAFPDIQAHIEDIFGEGDRVFSRVRLEGTNTGSFQNFPATGKHLNLCWMMSVARLQDGKVVEEWEVCDRMDAMAQLGHLPAEATEGATPAAR